MNGWVIALRLTGLGWYVAACIVGGIAGGLGLDKLIGTSPVFTLIGLALGIVTISGNVSWVPIPLVLYTRNP